LVQKSHAVKSAQFDLEGSLGADRVTKDSKTITSFATDMSGAQPKRANLVARPASPDQAREVVLIAGRFGLPLIPVVGKTNLSGLTIPDDGGVILDLRDLRGIHALNAEEMHVELEAGVTWEQLRDFLATNAPDLRFGYTFAPPDSSVVAACMMDAVLDLSLKYGSASQWINGLEVVLSNGDVVETGIGAVQDDVCTSAPLPNLGGLFVNSFGTLGIVTKATVQLWPAPARRATFAFAFGDAAAAVAFSRKLAREDVADDILLASAAADAMLRGEDPPAAAAPPSGGPGAFALVALGASRDPLLAAKSEAVTQVAAECGAGAGEPLDAFRSRHAGAAMLAELPARLGPLVDHEGGGLVWASAVGPTSRYAELIDRGTALLVERGFPPFWLVRTSRGGHHGEVTFALRFDKKDFDRKQVVAELQPELAELMTTCGFFPCRASTAVVERLKDRFDAGFRKLFLKVRKVLDPSAILNPARWPLEGRWTRESVVLAKPREGKPDPSGPVFKPKSGS